MSTLIAGVGRTISSPPLGTFLAGYANPFRVCKRVRDPLNVTVLILDDGQGRVALVTADLLAVHEDVAAKLRQAVARAANLDPDCVLIACSHSHCAPVASVSEAANDAQRIISGGCWRRLSDAIVRRARRAWLSASQPG